ncbi:MAG: TraR/DksA family transcriptional regulator [Planctomycetota bacterium]
MTQKQRKTSKKKASTNTKSNSLSDADLEYFKNLLVDKRRELFGDVNEIENETIRKTRSAANGDLSLMPIHMADLGTDNYEQELAVGLMDSERKLIREIDEALNRIEEKSYGNCLATGKLISKARLKAKPWAKYCMKYARKLEQSQ